MLHFEPGWRVPIISVVADRLGWFGLHHVPIGRLLGAALVIGGTVLVMRS